MKHRASIPSFGLSTKACHSFVSLQMKRQTPKWMKDTFTVFDKRFERGWRRALATEPGSEYHVKYFSGKPGSKACKSFSCLSDAVAVRECAVQICEVGLVLTHNSTWVTPHSHVMDMLLAHFDSMCP